jgi:hypothetical protein
MELNTNEVATTNIVLGGPIAVGASIQVESGIKT